jgi:hypothetical protein
LEGFLSIRQTVLVCALNRGLPPAVWTVNREKKCWITRDAKYGDRLEAVNCQRNQILRIAGRNGNA